MPEHFTLQQASQVLSNWLATKPDEVAAQKAALDYYGKYFSPANIDNITPDGFRDFLSFKHNRHWSNLQRHPEMYADMDRLRECLKILVDESCPIEKRLGKIIPKDGPPFVKGLNRAVLTPMLMCVYPEKYAVYNQISDEGLEILGRNKTHASDSFAKRYMAVNKACHEISAEINQPLHLVDSMFSLMVHGGDSPLHGDGSASGASSNGPATVPEAVSDDGGVRIVPPSEKLSFPLEKYLQDFIVNNWNKTLLGQMLKIHSEDGEEATEYETGVGRIDILARDKKNNDWVVIELKKDKDSDRVVGQLMRYMGWVKKHKATGPESVRGIIITNLPDDRIKYAMCMSDDISFYTYQVSFTLKEEAAM